MFLYLIYCESVCWNENSPNLWCFSLLNLIRLTFVYPISQKLNQIVLGNKSLDQWCILFSIPSISKAQPMVVLSELWIHYKLLQPSSLDAPHSCWTTCKLHKTGQPHIYWARTQVKPILINRLYIKINLLKNCIHQWIFYSVAISRGWEISFKLTILIRILFWLIQIPGTIVISRWH